MMSNPERKKIPNAPVPTPVPGNMVSSVAPPAQLPNFVIPNAPVPTPVPGNMLSSVAPPAQLPNFVTAAAPAVVPQVQPVPPPAPIPVTMPLPPVQQVESFSPVIPLSKGEPTLPLRSPDDSQETTQSPVSLPDSTMDVDKIGDIMPGSGLLTWVKGAVSSGGLLHRVAEKAKSSVDSMITTLDPQMKEYLNSGGDIHVVVASDKEVKISAVREAFQQVFGKATVIGVAAPSAVTAAQPVRCSSAYAAAKQRLAHVRAHCDVTNNVPVLAIEGFLHEAMADRWYEQSLLVLTLPSLGIELQALSQGCPVPGAAVTAAKGSPDEHYEHGDTGFRTTVGAVMADNLKVAHTQWQEAATGVSRKETLLLAARSLAGSYKRLLAISAAESS